MNTYMIVFSWLLSLLVAWGVSGNYQLNQLNWSLNSLIIIAIFLSIVSWPLCWIFKYSERFTAAKKPIPNALPSPTAEDTLRQQLDRLTPLSKQKAKNDGAELFTKVEKVVMSEEAVEETKNMKKQMQIKIWHVLNEQLFHLEKLQQEMLTMIDSSETLNDAEKLVLRHNVKSYIAQKQDDLTT